MEFLGDRVLDFNGFNLLVKRGKGVAPTAGVSNRCVIIILSRAIPFLWGNDFDNPGFHAVLIDLLDKCLEASELFHCLLIEEQSVSVLHGSANRDNWVNGYR